MFKDDIYDGVIIKLSPKFSLSNAAVSEKNNPKRLSKQIANVTWPTKP